MAVESSCMASFEVFDVGLKALYASVKAGNGVLQVFYLEGQLAANVANAVDFREYGLKFVECLEAVFDRAGGIGFVVCCHMVLTSILPDLIRFPNNRLQS